MTQKVSKVLTSVRIGYRTLRPSENLKTSYPLRPEGPSLQPYLLRPTPLNGMEESFLTLGW